MVTPVGPSFGANMPDGWGYAVADGVWGRKATIRPTRFNVTGMGANILGIWCLMPSVVAQKIMGDLGGMRQSLFWPPESFLVGRDTLGTHNGSSFANAPGMVGALG